MNIEQEKAYQLSSQERYDIIAQAMEYAEDDGFINQFVFVRTLYVLTARALYPDLLDKINDMLINQTPMVAWDTLLGNGTIDNMLADYSEDLATLAEDGSTWLEDFMTFRNSARGIIDVLQTFTQGIADNMGQQLDMFKNDADIASVQDIAEKWGLNADMAKKV